MKNMTLWQRLHTIFAVLIVLLLVGVGIAWWVQDTRYQTQSRSDQLRNAGDRIRRSVTHLGDCLRWGIQADAKSEEEKRVEELRAEVFSSIAFIQANYLEHPALLDAARALGDHTMKLAEAVKRRSREPADSNPGAPPLDRDLFANFNKAFGIFDKEVKDASKAEEGYSQTTALIGAIALLVILVACIWLGRLQARAIDRPLSILVDALEHMRSGDFTRKVRLDARDQFGILGEGLNRLVHDLSALVGQVQRSGIQVNTTTTEIAATAKEQQSTANEIAATTAEIGATSKEISATSKELVKTMNEVSDVAEETAQLAGTGQSAIARMEATMRQILDASGSISAKLTVLSEKTSNINSVVTTITKVADQTNLLSLNAAIEAEKAGEYGLGFAVVAMEIRRLADQTAVATYDIEKMVKEMHSAVAAGVMGMDKFGEEVRHGVEEIRQVSTQLAQIIHQVQTLTPRFQTVNEGMQSQATGAQQISETLTQLSEAAHQTADSLRQSNLAIEQLNQASRGLHTAVARFKLDI